MEEETRRLLDEALEEQGNTVPAEITKAANGISIEEDPTQTRFKDAPWFNAITGRNIHIVGCGGISSWLALLVARCNPNKLYIYDDDRVDKTNLGGQLFSRKDVGSFKTDAMRRILTEFASYHRTETRTERIQTSTYWEYCFPVLCGVDSMASRTTIFKAWLQGTHFGRINEDHLLIDGRLAAERFEVYCVVDQETADRYEQTLFSDTEAEETLCSYKQTSYCANMIASVMFNLLINYFEGIPLPFKVSYDGATMQLNKEY